MDDKGHSQPDNNYSERYTRRNELTSGEDKDPKADLHFRRHPPPVYERLF